ncbi:MAG: hypothetical protein ACI3W6_06130 [Clostridia bacterium]
MKENLMHIVKKDKKKLMLLIILTVAAVLLMVIGGGAGKSSVEKENVSAVSSDSSSRDPLDISGDLEQLLSRMEGAGEVKVLISWEGDVEETYAYDEETGETRKEDGTVESNQKRQMVLTDGDKEPVVTSRSYPEVRGVLVMAEGAGDDRVKERLLSAVASYLAIGKNRVEITVMEGQ